LQNNCAFVETCEPKRKRRRISRFMIRITIA